MNSSKQASRYSCALQMKLYASIVSLAGLLLYIKRMAKIPPFPCFTTTLIFAIPDSRIHPLRVCRSTSCYLPFCRDCAMKSKYSLRSCFLFPCAQSIYDTVHFLIFCSFYKSALTTPPS